ncbi:LytR C-terminal domain-containing protein [Duganella aceris]|uniref:Tetratricopeptide repeat protein n=1 Tax=Duganella aceris TaxID=2703883 RepID=A0ABX0FPW2_9BURK|nr:LytR C-terminal domain-containing protein [Duganella aceris]NGZ86507.1 tetratricopeptide repeat protein [Duganella aceris]
MTPLNKSVPVLLAACLLQACGGAPVKTELAIAPVLRIEDSAGLDAASLYQLGRYHQRRGEAAAAGAAFARSIALAPRQLDARNAQAALLAGQGQVDAAVALLLQVVGDFPDQVQPLSNLGYAYHLQGQDDLARTVLEQALARDPVHAQARANLALLGPAPVSAGARLVRSATASHAAPISKASSGAVARESVPPRMEVVQMAPNEFRLQQRSVDPLASLQPAPAAAAQDSAPPAADEGARLQIVNGNGVRGLGERVRRLLARHGIDAGRVVNQRGHYQRTTIIEYLPGQRPRADAMLAALHGRATLLPARALPGGLSLRLVLGRDHAASLALTDPDDTPASTPAPLLAALDRAAVPHFNQE